MIHRAIRERLTKELLRHEAMVLKPYRCTAGKLSIGVGRNLDDNGISKAEALYMLDNDISQAERDAYKVFGEDFMRFTGDRQIAILNMLFNLGLRKFQKFSNMIAAIKAGDWERAAVEALDSAWAKQVGGRSKDIADLLKGIP